MKRDSLSKYEISTRKNKHMEGLDSSSPPFVFYKDGYKNGEGTPFNFQILKSKIGRLSSFEERLFLDEKGKSR